MMRCWPIALALLAVAPAYAAGPTGAESCSGCHVPGAGIGSLQGRPADDIVAQLEAFRSGARPATLMNRIVKGFSPQEVQALAFWFASR
jgi:sulfide dehydrogenase cytochrome subunit